MVRLHSFLLREYLLKYICLNISCYFGNWFLMLHKCSLFLGDVALIEQYFSKCIVIRLLFVP